MKAWGPGNINWQKLTWIGCGIIIGMAVSVYWPHEPAYAEATTRADKFAMCNLQTTAGEADAVFVLDFLTGRLVGAAYNSQTGTFTQFYARNVAADFNVTADVDAQYVLLPSFLNPRVTRGGPVALGGLYVGEMNTGIVNLYGVTYRNAPRQTPPQQIALLATFPFRQAAP